MLNLRKARSTRKNMNDVSDELVRKLSEAGYRVTRFLADAHTIDVYDSSEMGDNDFELALANDPDSLNPLAMITVAKGVVMPANVQPVYNPDSLEVVQATNIVAEVIRDMLK